MSKKDLRKYLTAAVIALWMLAHIGVASSTSRIMGIASWWWLAQFYVIVIIGIYWAFVKYAWPDSDEE